MPVESAGSERRSATSVHCVCAVVTTASLLFIACSSGGGSGGSATETPPTCNNTCPSAGATQCSGSQVQTCTADAGGCLSWSGPTACSTGLTCDAELKACAGRLVTVSWAANRESGVNRTGGGYELLVSGLAPVLVPYISGATAPTSAAVRLPSGNHTISVRAFAALDSQGGSTRTYSPASDSVVLSVE
jgi:hypothetical protein